MVPTRAQSKRTRGPGQPITGQAPSSAPRPRPAPARHRLPPAIEAEDEWSHFTEKGRPGKPIDLLNVQFAPVPFYTGRSLGQTGELALADLQDRAGLEGRGVHVVGLGCDGLAVELDAAAVDVATSLTGARDQTGGL